MTEDALLRVFGMYGAIEDVHIVNQGGGVSWREIMSRPSLRLRVLHLHRRRGACARSPDAATEMEGQYRICKKGEEGSRQSLRVARRRQHRLQSHARGRIAGYFVQIRCHFPPLDLRRPGRGERVLQRQQVSRTGVRRVEREVLERARGACGAEWGCSWRESV